MNTKQKNKFARVAGVVLLMIMGGAAGFWGATTGIKAAAELPGEVVAVIALLFIPVCLLVIGVHEAGHALAGVAMNFDFRMYVVGPLLWDKETTGWKFKWNKNVNTFGGMVICIPPPSDDLNKRFSVYAAGGPVASFLLAVVAYIAYHILAGFALSGAGTVVVSNVLYIISIISAIIFIITMIPVHSGGFSSDGARMLRLWRGGDTARFEIMLLKIISTSMAGTRPLHYNLEELQEAQALAERIDAPMRIYLQYYFYYRALDNNDVDLAEQHLNKYIEQIEAVPEGIRGSVWIDAAFFYAFVKRDEARATTYYQRYKPSALVPKATVLATEAAIAHLHHNTEKTKTLAQQALAEIPNMIDRGVGIVLREKVTALLTPESSMANQFVYRPG